MALELFCSNGRLECFGGSRPEGEPGSSWRSYRNLTSGLGLPGDPAAILNLVTVPGGHGRGREETKDQEDEVMATNLAEIAKKSQQRKALFARLLAAEKAASAVLQSGKKLEGSLKSTGAALKDVKD